MTKRREGPETEGTRGDGRSTSGAGAREVSARAAAEVLRLAGEDFAPGLYLVATPIGNLGDITLRALAVLAGADMVYCEDTRLSRNLFSRFGISATLRPYHEHNAEEQRPRILDELSAGKTIALISDAGTPLISDPGWKLVRDVLSAGHAVFSIPGPCAAIAALTSAGLPTDAFYFAGFLPAKSGPRRTRIAELAHVPGTLIFYEGPSRAAESLSDLAAVLGPRPAALAREITKLHEEVRRESLDALAAFYSETEVRGEVVILVGPPSRAEVEDGAIENALSAALSDMSLRDAAKAVADVLCVSKARVYDLALKMQRSK